MARRGDHSLEEIKDMILVAAEDLVAEGGFSQLRVRNIAVKIGYTVGSIYMVFDSMTDLILHVKGRTLDAIAEQMDNIQAATPEQHLEELAAVYIRYVAQHFNRWSMVFEHRLPDDFAVPAWYQKKVDNIYNKFEKQFACVSPELNPVQRKQMALAFQGSIHGICVMMLTTPVSGLKESDLEEVIRVLIGQFVPQDWASSTSNVVPKHTTSLSDNWRVNP